MRDSIPQLCPINARLKELDALINRILKLNCQFLIELYNMKVLKFGGSSVATPARVQSAIEIIKPYLSGDVAIVFSAFGGVTDSLIQISKLALEGNLQYKNKLAELENRHLDAVRQLINIQRQSSILAQVKFHDQ